MTAPQDDQQDQHLTSEEEAAIVALALFFASLLAVKAINLPTNLTAQLVALGLSPQAVRAAGRIALAPPLTGRGRYGSPVKDTVTTINVTARRMKADEPLMRARYVLAAAKRLTKAGMHGTFPQALRVETVYMAQHRAAAKNRVSAAARYANAAAEAGPDGKLRWTAVMDERTTADCAALNGTLFTPDNPPGGLVPGAVHARCRCTATPVVDLFSSAPTVSASGR